MQFKKHLPTREQIREIRMLRFLGDVLFQPNLWHMNRHSVSWAMLVGWICCFLPVPFQMVPGVLCCIWLRCNVPLVLVIIWISNPLTMPPMYYFSYRLGSFLLGREQTATGFEFTLDGILTQLAVIWQPLVVGSFTAGITMGVLGFVGVRLYYRWKIARYWNRRRQRNKLIR